MKKLFLLPLLAITLVGCGTNKSTDGTYHKVDSDKILTICIGDIDSISYFGGEFYKLEYQAISGEVFTVNVRYQKTQETPTKIDIYCGKTISYVIGG